MNILKIDQNFIKNTVKLNVSSSSEKKYTLVIPSKYFPLDNPKTMEAFTSENTTPVEDKTIREIVDKIGFKPGFCYTNTETFCEEALKAGIKAEFYSGWVFMGSAPIHHAWAVIDGTHLIDLSVTEKSLYEKMEDEIPIDEMRLKIVERMLELEKLPCSQFCTMGQCADDFLYIGSKSTRIKSVELYNKAIALKDNPLHALTTKRNHVKGISDTQTLYYKEKKEEL